MITFFFLFLLISLILIFYVMKLCIKDFIKFFKENIHSGFLYILILIYLLIAFIYTTATFSFLYIMYLILNKWLCVN